MTTSLPGNQAADSHEVQACGRCGQRFPYTASTDPASDRFCEPCRAALWFEDHDHTVSDTMI